MSVAAILRELVDKGARVGVEKGDLKILARRGALNPELIDRLRQHKPQLVTLVRALPRCCICNATIAERLPTSLGGGPCHRVCGESAFDQARTRGDYDRH
jgi:TubC N-terminal docking domain